MTGFSHIHKRIYLALYGLEKARKMAHHHLKGNFLVISFHDLTGSSILDADQLLNPVSVTEMYNFDYVIRSLQRTNALQKVVVCAGSNPAEQSRAILLLGTHLMMTHGFNFDAVENLFKPQCAHIDSRNHQSDQLVSIQAYWRALFQTKCLGWIDFRETFACSRQTEQCIDMEEYVHYANPINGAVYTVLPGKLVCFRTPCNALPPGQDWLDSDGQRLFSASFYADLLRDLGVTLVLHFDAAAGGVIDADVFETRGISVCTLADICSPDAAGGDDDEGESCVVSFQTLDRFFAVLSNNCSDGLVAVCVGDRPLSVPASPTHDTPFDVRDDDDIGGEPRAAEAKASGCGGCDLAGTLMAAYLLQQRCFDRRSDAVAWLRMAFPARHPAATSAAAAAAAVHSLLAGPAARRLRSSRRNVSLSADSRDCCSALQLLP